MHISLLKAVVFVGAAIGLSIAAGPVVGVLAGATGASSVPVWIYAAVVSTLLLPATALAFRWDGGGLRNLGLTSSRHRVGELALGFAVGSGLFALLAGVRGASVGAVWTFTGMNAPGVAGSLVVALLLLLPEELLFRGYAFQRLVHAIGTWPGILISAALFGVYHVVGSGMWGMGAFFQAAMPALGGIVFGWAAVRTKGLALPIGLHLGGNWVTAAVFTFRPHSEGAPTAVWTAYVTGIQQRSLYAPDLGAHAPFIAMMFLAIMTLHVVLPRLERKQNRVPQTV